MNFRRLLHSALTSSLLLGSVATQALAEVKSFDTQSDRLVIGLAAALASIDPIKANSPRTEGNVLTNIYSVLARVGPDGQLVGDAAEKWEQIAPNEWLFTLRPGIHFTNGAPLDADAVVAAYTRSMDKSQSAVASRLASFESIEAKSPTEVLIRTKSLDLYFPWRTEEVYLTEKGWLESNNPAVSALGSGPYKLVSYDPQGQILLERNEEFYGPKPAFRTVELRVLATEANRLAALQAGEVDVATGLDPISLDQIKDNADYHVGALPSFRSHFILIDSSKPPFDNADVRRAVNYAVNKQEITETVLRGLVEPASQFFNKGMPGHDPDLKPYPYDPAKAKELLAAAGYPDGFSTEILNAPGSYAGDDLITQAIAQQLSEVGIQVSIRNLPYTAYLDNLFRTGPGKEPSALNFRSFSHRFAANNTTRVQVFTSDTCGAVYNNPEYDALRTQAFTAPTIEEQEAAYRKLNHLIQDEALLILLFDEPQTYVYSKGLDWVPRPENWLRAYDFGAAN